MNRHIDKMGRIVIPREICKALNISTNDNLDIEVIGTKIVIRKYQEKDTIGYINYLLEQGVNAQQKEILKKVLNYMEGYNESI